MTEPILSDVVNHRAARVLSLGKNKLLGNLYTLVAFHVYRLCLIIVETLQLSDNNVRSCGLQSFRGGDLFTAVQALISLASLERFWFHEIFKARTEC